MMQFIFLLISTPFVVIGVVGRLAIALGIAAAISWFIVGHQQLGINIGRKMPTEDIVVLLLVTIGLALTVGIFFVLHNLVKKYEESYFSIWAKQFVRIKELLQY